MTAPPPLRLGLIGTGAIARLGHLPAIRAVPATRITAVCDADRARAEAFAREAGDARVLDGHEAVAADRAVDAVIVATPNVDHRAAVEAAAAAGKPVLCEKPLATSVTDAHAMVTACRKAGVALLVGHNQRFWTQVRIAKQLIDSGLLGRIHGFRSILAERWNNFPAATGYRYDLAKSGGVTISDLTIHRIDLIRYLLGDLRSLVAELRHCAMPHAGDDNVWLLANLAGGATGCLSSDRYSPTVADGTDLYGTEGTLHLATESINPFHAVPLAVYTDRKIDELPEVLRQAHYPEAWWKTFQGGWIAVRPPRISPYVEQLKAFRQAIATGDANGASLGEDGYRAVEAVQAAYISVRERRWVDLPLPTDTPLQLPEYASR